jgi:enoyl-CoA hydratase/carnithine racemase
VGTITLNRPPANAYETQFQQAFNAAIETANGDDELRVVVLSSASEKFFSAGADIHVFQANDTAANQDMVRLARAALAKITASSKIYICAIQGHALGGGLEIAMACDLRFAAQGSYQLGLPEVRLGLMPANGGTQRLARLVGPSRALEILLTGESIDPETAHRIGLIDQLLPAESFRTETEAFALQLAKGPALALAAIKRAVYEGIALPLADGLALEETLAGQLYDTSDAVEGFAAFTEKRMPIFTGQ